MKRKFLIHEGHHRPEIPILPLPIWTGSVRLRRTYQFTPSCWWWFDDPDKDEDWSKIMGFVCGLNIHGESYRFGFRPAPKGKLQVAPYIYQNGVRIPNTPILATVSLPVELTLEIVSTGLHVWFGVYMGTKRLGWHAVSIGKTPTLGWTTGIYVGGGVNGKKDWTPPHDVEIWRVE